MGDKNARTYDHEKIEDRGGSLIVQRFLGYRTNNGGQHTCVVSKGHHHVKLHNPFTRVEVSGHLTFGGKIGRTDCLNRLLSVTCCMILRTLPANEAGMALVRFGE